MIDICEEAHYATCPDVPLCGWDVAYTTKGQVLLEVNLSCNFFQAQFDEARYISFVNKSLLGLDAERQTLASSSLSV
jgi:glutathione synthase/RimK-type ligase-like ATP-grasp enzyme